MLYESIVCIYLRIMLGSNLMPWFVANLWNGLSYKIKTEGKQYMCKKCRTSRVSVYICCAIQGLTKSFLYSNHVGLCLWKNTVRNVKKQPKLIPGRDAFSNQCDCAWVAKVFASSVFLCLCDYLNATIPHVAFWWLTARNLAISDAKAHIKHPVER